MVPTYHPENRLPETTVVARIASDTTDAALIFNWDNGTRSVTLVDRDDTVLFSTTVPDKICCNFRDAILYRPDSKDDTFECTTIVRKWDKNQRADVWLGSITIGVHPRACGYIEISHPPNDTKHLFYIEDGDAIDLIIEFLS